MRRADHMTASFKFRFVDSPSLPPSHTYVVYSMPPRPEPATYNLTDADLDILEDYRDRYKVAKRHQRKPILNKSVATVIKKLEESEPVMTKVRLGVSQEVPKSINDLIGFFMRNWTPKSVLEYLMRGEIKEKQVEKQQEKDDPEGSFKYYQAAVSELMKGLDAATKWDHEKLAIEWNTLRPPLVVQQRAAENSKAVCEVVLRDFLNLTWMQQSGKKSSVSWGQLAVQPDLWINWKWFPADGVFKDPSKMHRDNSYAVLLKLSDVTQNGIFRFLRLSHAQRDEPVTTATATPAGTSGKSRGTGKASSKRKGQSAITEGKRGRSGKGRQSSVNESGAEASSTDESDHSDIEDSGVKVNGQVGRHRPYISPYGRTEKDNGIAVSTALAAGIGTLPTNLFPGDVGSFPTSAHPLGGDASVTPPLTSMASSSVEGGQVGVSSASAGKASDRTMLVRPQPHPAYGKKSSGENDRQWPHQDTASNLSEVRGAGNDQPLTDVSDERVNPAPPVVKPGKKKWLVPVVEISSLGCVGPPSKKRKVDANSVTIEPPKTPMQPPLTPRRSARQSVTGGKSSRQSGKAGQTPNGQSKS
ncbi:hypothetical protein JAAARDRAFT_200896 [Jaapia argillacea MUCL 33604]|uniref:Uncharacterized protein n=1 Tax=Jaapia argillacea MUCL 33604 TaxID=933084 RepID=A0A067P6J5_9AGAM|nr:hypothetical protein JAAARDRAFT_200896 [Jaapia argillacea MUCL 33604]